MTDAIVAMRSLHDYSGVRSESAKLVRAALAELFRDHTIIRSIAIEELEGFISADGESYITWLNNIRRGMICSPKALEMKAFVASDPNDERIRERAIDPLSRLTKLPSKKTYPIALMRSAGTDGFETEWARKMRFELCSVRSTIIPKHLTSSIKCSLELIVHLAGTWTLVYATSHDAANALEHKISDLVANNPPREKNGQGVNLVVVIDLK